MVQGDITCPKCKAAMHEGFLAEESRQAHWYQGKLRYWLGMAAPRWAKTQLPITTYRCPSCGYLESYAK